MAWSTGVVGDSASRTPGELWVWLDVEPAGAGCCGWTWSPGCWLPGCGSAAGRGAGSCCWRVAALAPGGVWTLEGWTACTAGQEEGGVCVCVSVSACDGHSDT
ncbi:hypothetical protein Zm00014a_029088 [Zea mays]|uniref:Uncharacterized protein n=1 Tax=Zea mays TaxID=4577 RepID=A0A3L6E7E7_MAIZE|nr:hypothetical protein Zm00014a_029088 [Zea mays]